MERLPRPILGELMGFLDIKEVFLAFCLVNKTFHSVAFNEVYLSNYLESKYNFHKKITISVPEALEFLRQVKQPIDIHGFGTTGGSQQNRSIYWVSNLYDIHDKARGYPSARNKLNINTVGVLLDAQDQQTDKKIFSKMSDMLKQLGCPLNLGYMLTHATSMETVWENVCNRCSANSEQLEEIKGEFEQLFYMYREYSIQNLDLLRRYPDNHHVLLSKIDYAQADSGCCMFATNEVYFSRPLDYTCPVETFMVFVSDRYIDIESQDFEFYNNLLTPESLDALFEGNLRISELKHHNGVYYRTFSPNQMPLKPLLWGKFERTAHEINVLLEDWFTGVYLYTKLINPDNRNRERGHLHGEFNIDAFRVKIKGIKSYFNS